MASSYNLTIDDSSPLISYGPSGAWQDASSNDTAGLPYTAGTFHSTTASGATATIHFNGTGIEVYGGHRPEYGVYSMTVDGQTVASGTAASSEIEAQQLLGSATGLANGPHTAILTSSGVGMDIDWANLITQTGSPGSTTSTIVVDDASPAITYAGPWQTNNIAEYMNGTLHYTQGQGAAASLPFFGSAVAVYGTVAPDHANVQIAIDGQTTLINAQSASISAVHPYYANNLDSSQHMLIITNPGQQTGTGPFIDLDSITVYEATAPAGPNPSAIANQSPNPGPSASANQSGGGSASRTGTQVKSVFGLPTGAMVGIIVAGSIAVLGLIALFLFLLVRQKRRRRARVVDPSTPVDAELPIQGPNMRTRFTPDTPVQPQPTFTQLATRHSIAPSYYAFSDSTESVASTTPMVPAVPTLNMPKVPSRAQQGVMNRELRPNRL
ncbi:hypothetical protein GGX14DRAFT_438211 [Mycena pura]|uniref:Uncharacterized protein n=1 Tax=Mycena pura TaxID=153505 RepID=A0AAD6VRB4_9AGAR|nr:hypothetical protein GGX14DRAFT_438211 [Mycena pura]